MKIFLKKILVYILTLESRLILKRYKPKIITITGNIGKTSTKDALFIALKPFTHVRKSEKSFNTNIGIPLTIIGASNEGTGFFRWFLVIYKGLIQLIVRKRYPEFLILEVGADKPGDIKSLTSWLQPDVTLMTEFPEIPVHIEFFESREAFVEEKLLLMKALKSDGLLVLNADDEYVRQFSYDFSQKTVTYGFSKTSTIRGSKIAVLYEKVALGFPLPVGINVEIIVNGESRSLEMRGVLGIGQVYAVLGALSVVYGLGFDIEGALRALQTYEASPGRLKPLLGMKQSLIIDDTYNSSPSACEGALNVLRGLKSKGKKIAVLGDMLELGKYTLTAHRDIGNIVPTSCDILISVGIRAKTISDTAFAHGMDREKLMHVGSHNEASELLLSMISPGDIILVKGSQNMRLEKTVKAIMASPENASELLVRQEEEWLFS